MLVTLKMYERNRSLLKKIVLLVALCVLIGTGVGIYFIVKKNKTKNQPYKNIRPGIPNDGNLGVLINKIRQSKGAGKLCNDLGLDTCMYVQAYTKYELKECINYYRFKNATTAFMDTVFEDQIASKLQNEAYSFLFDPKYISFGRSSVGSNKLYFAVSTNGCRKYEFEDEETHS